MEFVTVTYAGGISGGIVSLGAPFELLNSRIEYSSSYGLYGTDIKSIVISQYLRQN